MNYQLKAPPPSPRPPHPPCPPRCSARPPPGSVLWAGVVQAEPAESPREDEPRTRPPLVRVRRAFPLGENIPSSLRLPFLLAPLADLYFQQLIITLPYPIMTSQCSSNLFVAYRRRILSHYSCPYRCPSGRSTCPSWPTIPAWRSCSAPTSSRCLSPWPRCP